MTEMQNKKNIQGNKEGYDTLRVKKAQTCFTLVLVYQDIHV